MNKLTIIGNLTRDPELRSLSSGIQVCTFTVAVNRRNRSQNAENGQPEADFFRVTAWRQLGENCARYPSKGRKVSLEVTADDVEFLSPRSEMGEAAPAQGAPAAAAKPAAPAGSYVRVDEEELPF